jgi:hypothetical protein
MRAFSLFAKSFKNNSANLTTRAKPRGDPSDKALPWVLTSLPIWQAAAVVGLAGASLLGWQSVSHNVAQADELEAEAKMAKGTSLKHKMGTLVSDVLQPYAPLRQFGAHIDAFCWVSGDQNRQLEGHTFVVFLNDDLAQCITYDSDKPNARLIGVEYIVSDKIFKTLPAEEQALWSSNAYKIKSGIAVAPRLPQVAENSLLGDEIRTYSKKILTWHVDKDYLPRGIPQLCFNFTEDGPKLDEELLRRRDYRMGIDSHQLAEARKHLPEFAPSRNADSWKSGYDPVLKLDKVRH